MQQQKQDAGFYLSCVGAIYNLVSCNLCLDARPPLGIFLDWRAAPAGVIEDDNVPAAVIGDAPTVAGDPHTEILPTGGVVPPFWWWIWCIDGIGNG